MPSRQQGILRLTGSKYYPAIVTALAVLSHGGFALSGQGFTPFYPFIQEDLNLTRTQVGFITGTIFGAATSTSVAFGWAIDRYGVRFIGGGFMILSGLVVSTLYFGTSFFIVLLIAAAMGTLRPVGHPAGTKAIMDWVPGRRRGTAMSIKQAGNPIMGALAAGLIPPIAMAFGWRTAAVALGAFIVMGGVLILALYRDQRSVRGSQPLLAKPLAGLGNVVRNKNISFAIAFGFPLVGAQVAALTYFILFLNDDLGVSLVIGGGLLAVLQISSVVMRIGWGIISDTVGKGRRKPVLLVSGLGTSAVFLMMALLPDGTPGWGLVLAAVLLGATATSWVSVHSVMLAELADSHQVGTAIGYASMVQRSAIVITPPFFGFLADGWGYQVAWLSMAAAILIGMVFLAPVRERGTNGRSES